LEKTHKQHTERSIKQERKYLCIFLNGILSAGKILVF